MAYREVSVVEVREVLRGWLGGAGLRTVAEPQPRPLPGLLADRPIASVPAGQVHNE
jgi:hypothetical protein